VPTEIEYVAEYGDDGAEADGYTESAYVPEPREEPDCFGCCDLGCSACCGCGGTCTACLRAADNPGQPIADPWSGAPVTYSSDEPPF
jgi:hypothetical protein